MQRVGAVYTDALSRLFKTKSPNLVLGGLLRYSWVSIRPDKALNSKVMFGREPQVLLALNILFQVTFS